MTSPSDILAFWFGAPGTPEHGTSRKAWFVKDPKFDDEIRGRFAADVEAAIAGAYADWEESPNGVLTLMLLLDQFPRNLFRGEARAFAGDVRALALAKRAVAAGIDKSRLMVERLFIYLPFEHSEIVDDQDRAVVLVSALGDKEFTDFAERHRAIVARFGRFPHRNAALGRTSTPEEIAFLKEPGSSF